MEMEPVIRIDESDLVAKGGEIKKAIEAQGFALLEPWDREPDTLRRVGSLFGDIQSHIRADERGVVGVGGPQRAAEWQQFRAEYHGLGTKDVAPHSDGTFVDGLVVHGDQMLRVGPPRYVILHVVRHADDGGASVIVDGQRVLATLLRRAPELAATLMTPGCITFCRDDQLALGQCVFRRVAPDHVKIRFRGDSKAYAPAWALPAVRRLIDEYHLAPEFRTRVDVGEGQILVVDNTRVLHGREQFTNEESGAGDGRKLHRVWIFDDDDDRLCNVESEVPTSRALDVYRPYGPVRNELAVDSPIDIQTGIRLDAQSMALLDGAMP